MHVHLFLENLLHDRSNLVDFDDCLSILGLALPAHEGISSRRGDEVGKHQLFLHFDDLVAEDLPSQVRVVAEQLASVHFKQRVC